MFFAAEGTLMAKVRVLDSSVARDAITDRFIQSFVFSYTNDEVERKESALKEMIQLAD